MSEISLTNSASYMAAEPSNLEAEQALLGAILIDNQLVDRVSGYLNPEHFMHPVHGRIYASILSLNDRGIIANPITIRDYLERDNVLDAVGGMDYVFSLVSRVFLIKGAQEYGKLIHEAFLKRQLIHIAYDIVEKTTNATNTMSAMSLLEHGERLFYNLAQHGHGTEKKIIPFSQALEQSILTIEAAFKRKTHLVGVSTGLVDLDEWLGGLHRSDLLILAGRPSMGKTALATNIAFNAAKAFLDTPEAGARVLFFSLEMSAEQLASRILSTATQISSHSIRKGSVTNDEFERFIEAARDLQSIPLYIDDTPGLGIASLRNRARRLKRQSGLDLIVVDYLQLLEGVTKENRVQEISEITRSLKGIAKELNVPVIALSQLSRAVEQREDKRPLLSDLRESGSIEQDADVVMFVYREEYYLERQEPSGSEEKRLEWHKKMLDAHQRAEVLIAKQRHGPVGTIKLFFDGNLTRFGNFSERSGDR